MRNTHYYIIVLQILFCSAFQSLSAFNKNDISFNRFPLSDFLTGNTVKRLFQDRQGYMWLGSEMGLYRYDGYTITTIKSTFDHPDLLTNNHILCMTQDVQNRLWIGTAKGVNVIDENGRVQNITKNHIIQESKINTIYATSYGDIWIGTEYGVFVYDNIKKQFKSYTHDKLKPGSISGNNVNHIFEDKWGNIWVALWGDGLCKYNFEKDSFTQMPRIGKKNNPYRLFQDKKGNIWVGTWGDGLFKMTFRTPYSAATYTQYKNVVSADRQNRNVVYSITQDDEYDYMWILTHQGLSVLTDQNKDYFEHINTNEILNNGSNFLHQVYKDKNGLLWVGSSNDGVYTINLSKSSFASNPLSSVKNKYGYAIVSALHQEGQHLFIGLSNFGYCVMNIPTKDSKSNNIIYDSNLSQTIQCFCKNKTDNSIWIGGDSLSKIENSGQDFKTSAVKFSNIPSTASLSSLFGMICTIYSDKMNKMWLGTQKGLFTVNRKMKLERIMGSQYNDISSICEDNAGNYWIGSFSKGLIRLYLNSKGKYEYQYYNHQKLRSSNINCIKQDSKGRIWVGTNESGLWLYDPNKDIFLSQNKPFSILEDNIINIQEDQYGNLWMSSVNKIIKLNTNFQTSTQFSRNDNIRTLSFKINSSLRSNNNNIFFGGNNGFCYILDDNKSTQPAGDVVFTDIQIHNQSIFGNTTDNHYNTEKNILNLNYNEKNFSLEFSSLNYVSPASIKYAYILEGVDKEWNYVDSKRRFVNYHNLKAGNYTFKVKATNVNGQWNEKPSMLNIEISNAPYNTWWAKLIYIFLLSGIFYFLYKNTSNKLKLKNALAISKIEKEKAEELNQTKLRYFTNVSHEILTPLTIISCLVDESKTSPKEKPDYNAIDANINRLKRLLQQILDFRKTESGNMSLNLTHDDISQFIKSICLFNFSPLVRSKNIHFHVSSNPEKIETWFDKDKIDKILFNLLSNAFKYTPNEGTISVTLQTIYKQKLLYLQIFVNDTGKGIEPKDLPKIFDRFYCATGSTTKSNGIGLSLTKDLVELHKGSINVENQLNSGTTFIVEIPLEESMYHQEILAQKPKIDLIYDSINDSNQNIPEITRKETRNSAIESGDNTLLIVEDNKELLDILYKHFSNKYEVYMAKNGLEALDILKEKEISLIISDVTMPEMTGIELCKTIKQNFETLHIPVILLTAKNQIEDRIDCYNAGVDGYMSKPFEMRVLDARIEGLLKNKKQKIEEFQTTAEINIKDLEYNSLDEEFLNKAIQAVENNLSEFEFSQEQLVETMNTTKSTLYRKLKSLSGLSPSEFIKNIRLKHARQMLMKDTGNISDIAYSVGFSDPKYFSTCFKAEFGMSPREFLKKQTKTEQSKNKIS